MQGYDRYAYVNNNPLRYTDPSGHVSCTSDGGYCKPSTPVILHSTLLLFNGTFTSAERKQFEESTQDLANSMAGAINKFNDKLCNVFGEECRSEVTPDDAFLSAFGGPITFRKIAHSCADHFNNSSYNCWGSYAGGTTINIYTNANPEKIVGVFQFPVHEMFHAIDGATGYTARDFFALDVALMSQNGLDTASRGWSQSSEFWSWEVFADTGIAWTYNHYNPSAVIYRGNGYNGTYTSYVSSVMNNFMLRFLLGKFYESP